MELRLEQTCGACPEQYDVFLGDENVGYLRLRHGYFVAECKGESVYESTTEGDGLFDCDERDYHLNTAKEAIMQRLEEISDLEEDLEGFKPCPMCGRSAKIYRQSELWVNREYSVGCEKCGLHQEGHTKLSVVKKRWNLRA